MYPTDYTVRGSVPKDEKWFATAGRPAASTGSTTLLHPEAVWTTLGTTLLLAIFAWHGNGFRPALAALHAFVTGDIAHLHHYTSLTGATFFYLAAMVVMMMVVLLPVGLLVIKLVGEPSIPSKLFDIGDTRAPLYALIMGTLFLEELFARQVFLGWLRLAFTSTAALYVLFFIGNCIWALVHLRNYKDPRDRQIVRVLPQFLAGIPFTVVYLQYGFLAALLVHIAYDMLLFCMHKRNRFNIGEVRVLIYNSLQLAVGAILFRAWGKSPFALLKWLRFDGNYAIAGWGFWQYVVAVMMAGAVFTIASDLLLYDFVRPKKMYSLLVIVLASAISYGLFAFTYWMSGFGHWDNIKRLIIVAMVLILMNLSHSGSALARSFWFSIPMTVMVICVMLAFGNAWLTIAALLVLSLVDVPEQYMRYIDRW